MKFNKLKIAPKVQLLLAKPFHLQKSKEWFDARKGCLSASELAGCLYKTKENCEAYVESYNLQDDFDYNNSKVCNPYSSYLEFMKKKIGMGPPFTGNIMTYWGQAYEPIAQQLYSHMKKAPIIEFGFIRHPTHSFLGASPDGITPAGKMLEIKCVYRRNITGVPTLYYWIQMQLQMEVCDLNKCDFLECKFTEYSQQEYLYDTTHDVKGCFIEILPCDGKSFTEHSVYIYPPIDTVQHLWIDRWMSSNVPDTDRKYKVHYYHLENHSLITVERNKKWFANVLPLLANVHAEVGYHKNTEGKFLANQQGILLTDLPDATFRTSTKRNSEVLEEPLRDPKQLMFSSNIFHGK
jgi:putative phage-type endonuclease